MGLNRNKSYLAVRDSELCLIPAQALTFMKSRCTAVLAKLITVLGTRLTRGGSPGAADQDKNENVVVKYGTVAVFPTAPNVPITAFCLEVCFN